MNHMDYNPYLTQERNQRIFREVDSVRQWDTPSERLDYYKGHRPGSETRCDRRVEP